jgi:hypothetical protein
MNKPRPIPTDPGNLLPLGLAFTINVSRKRRTTMTTYGNKKKFPPYLHDLKSVKSKIENKKQ